MSIETERVVAFKLGFLRKLAECGVTPAQFFERAKSAAVLDPMLESIGRLGEQAIGGAAGAGITGAKYLAGLGLVAPIALGGGAGVAHTLLDAPNDQDIETLQQAELESTYRRMAEEIKNRAKHRVLGE